MSTIVTRAGKGSPLTNTEVDANFTNLNSDKVEKSGDTLTGDLAFGDNVKAKFGASDDLQIYHSGSNSVITDVGQGSLYIGGDNNVIIASGNLNTTKARFTLTDVELYYEGEQKFATTSSGVDITGNLVADGLTVGSSTLTESSSDLTINAADDLFLNVNGSTAVQFFQNAGALQNVLFKNNSGGNVLEISGASGDTQFYEDTGTTVKLTWDASAEELQFKDNVKAEFGDGGDLQIVHNGTNSQILNNTGTLKIVQNVDDGDVEINADNSSGGTANYFKADGSTGEVQLYHYGSEKLATKSTGIDVTGTVTADGLTVENSADTTINFGNAVDANDGTTINVRKGAFTSSKIQFLRTDDQYNDFEIKVADDEDVSLTYGQGNVSNDLWVRRSSSLTPVLRLKDSGDISFYDDSGTSQDFYWDASTSRLGLGTTTPSAPLTVDTSAGTFAVEGDGGSSNLISSTGALSLKSGQFQTQINQSDNTPIARFVANTGDVLFYNDSGSSQDFYWDASTSRLGIGTTSPLSDIHIAQSSPVIRLEDTDNNAIAQILYNTASGGLLLRSDVTQATGASGSNIIFQTDGSEAMRIDSSGRLLIGTTNSDPWRSAQDVIQLGENGSVTHYEGLVTSLNHNYYIDSAGNPKYSQTGQEVFAVSLNSYDNAIKFIYAPSGTAGDTFSFNTAAVIDSSGNVGIGTTSPDGLLHISSGTSGDAIVIIEADTDNNDETDVPQLWFKADGDINEGAVRLNDNYLQFISNTSFQSGFQWSTGSTNNTGTTSPATGANEKMRLTYEGRLGIGTTSPASALHVRDTSNAEITIQDAISSATARIGVYGAGGNLTYDTNASGDHIFTTNNRATEFMRIDSSGNVGIGTTSPADLLHIQGADVGLVLDDTDGTSTHQQTWLKSDNGNLRLQTRNSSGGFVSNDYLVQKGASGATSHEWRIDNSEAARIDSSGNLLVGTTDSTLYNNTSGEGVGLIGGDHIEVARSGGPALFLNRMTSDGDIAEFRKDGTTIGSIGVDNTDNIFLSGNSGHSGLMVGTPGIIAYANGNVSDATEDLGQSSVRWRNLYLSGGVYLGGTGANNLLDDYEEGTTTVTYRNLTDTPTTDAANYVKTGDLVCISGYLNLSGSETWGGALFDIRDLPFIRYDRTTFNDAACIGTAVVNGSLCLLRWQGILGGGFELFYISDGSKVDTADIASGSIISWSVTYRTT